MAWQKAALARGVEATEAREEGVHTGTRVCRNAVLDHAHEEAATVDTESGEAASSENAECVLLAQLSLVLGPHFLEKFSDVR